MSDEVKIVDEVRCFEGVVKRCEHIAKSLGGLNAKFSVYVPDKANDTAKVPQVYCLAGLTSTDENFLIKANAIRQASRLGYALVCPDTSPRGAGCEGEDESWDFGTGAGFYLNATVEPWAKHYRMYDYVLNELPSVVEGKFPFDSSRKAAIGHSMGGHGVLCLGLKNPGHFKAVVAVAPISNPSAEDCPWGQKAFSNYLGPEKATWEDWDATKLMQKYGGPDLHLFIDQGDKDGFHKTQLYPERLVAACEKAKMKPIFNIRHGYDHGYYFIQTFIEEYFDHISKFV